MSFACQEKALRRFLRPNAALCGTSESQLLSLDRPVARLSTSIASSAPDAGPKDSFALVTSTAGFARSSVLSLPVPSTLQFNPLMQIGIQADCLKA